MSTAAPRARASRSRWCTSATAVKSRPKLGLLTSSRLASSESSRASTARCTLPPDKELIGDCSLRVRTRKACTSSRARWRTAPLRRQPAQANGASSKRRSAMFSATLMPGTQALCMGSSGRLRTRRARFCVRVAA